MLDDWRLADLTDSERAEAIARMEQLYARFMTAERRARMFRPREIEGAEVMGRERGHQGG